MIQLRATRRSGTILPACAMFVMMAALGGAQADHIPGHDDCDAVFPVPFPDQDNCCGGGSIVFVTAIGPLPEQQVLKTTIRIKYVSDGATPASDLLLNISVPVDGQTREMELTGADLGFGSGPGTFMGELRTDFFDGEIWQNGPFGNSVVELGIGAVDGGIEGSAYFVNSFILFNQGLAVETASPTLVHYKSPFDVATGLLSDLRTTGDFAAATCLGTFSTTTGADSLPDPPSGDGRYYLARGLEFCAEYGYGDSSLDPDPRDALNRNPPCP